MPVTAKMFVPKFNRVVVVDAADVPAWQAQGAIHEHELVNGELPVVAPVGEPVAPLTGGESDDDDELEAILNELGLTEDTEEETPAAVEAAKPTPKKAVKTAAKKSA